MNPLSTPAMRRSSPPLPLGEGRGEGAPRAFTLIELLVVIGIIAMLAALLTPILMQSLTKARNAAIKAEIDMLHMAIMNYKNEYGSFPPCFDAFTLTGTSVVGRHVLRAFPRCTTVSASTQLNALLNSPPPNGPKNPNFIVPSNALAFWLSGYTTDPQTPLSPGNRRKLFDFDSSRVDNASGIYFPSGKPGSPYIYINRSEYGNSWPPAGGYTYSVNGQSYTIPAATYQAFLANGAFLNPDTFQILCAGRDEIFGNDDDLSNFWPGTRGEYLDSPKQ